MCVCLCEILASSSLVWHEEANERSPRGNVQKCVSCPPALPCKETKNELAWRDRTHALLKTASS